MKNLKLLFCFVCILLLQHSLKAQVIKSEVITKNIEHSPYYNGRTNGYVCSFTFRYAFAMFFKGNIDLSSIRSTNKSIVYSYYIYEGNQYYRGTDIPEDLFDKGVFSPSISLDVTFYRDRTDIGSKTIIPLPGSEIGYLSSDAVTTTNNTDENINLYTLTINKVNFNTENYDINEYLKNKLKDQKIKKRLKYANDLFQENHLYSAKSYVDEALSIDPSNIEAIQLSAKIEEALNTEEDKNNNRPMPAKEEVSNIEESKNSNKPIVIDLNNINPNDIDVSNLKDVGDAMKKIGRDDLAKIFYDKLNETENKDENSVLKEDGALGVTKEKTTTINNNNNANTVTDIDGNVYNVVKIGTQYWMQENLKTTRYNDGIAIPTDLSKDQWHDTKNGAYAIYENNAANDATYGKLYNWYAVNTSKLCPVSWHVPSVEEWVSLKEYLSMSYPDYGVGKSMKSTTMWKKKYDDVSDPNNISGFTALPAGIRGEYGHIWGLGDVAWFWSSYEAPYNHYCKILCGKSYKLTNENNYFEIKGAYEVEGFSVRCVRD